MTWVGKQVRRGTDFWLGPIEAVRLRVFEMAFVSAFLCYFFVARFRYWREWLTPEGFHFTPTANLSALVDPYRLLEPWAAIGLGIAVGIAGGLVLIGKWRRPALAVLFGTAVYIKDADALGSFALNHHFIVGLLILLVSPMRRFRQENDDPKNGGAEMIASAWPVRTLQATILLQFFTSGWCKLHYRDWLEHWDVLWTYSQGVYRNAFADWLLKVVPMGGWAVLQFFALAFELVGPFLIAIPKTRWVGLAMALGFVVFIGTTMNDLLYFMLQITAYLTLFLPVGMLEKVRGQVLKGLKQRSYTKPE